MTAPGRPRPLMTAPRRHRPLHRELVVLPSCGSPLTLQARACAEAEGT